MDAFLAMVVFIFALAMVSIVTSQSVGQDVRELNSVYFQSETQRLVYSLMQGAGNPSHWDTLPDRNDVLVVGFMSGDGELSRPKWETFVDWNGADYNSLRTAMGIPSRDFFIRIIDSNQTELGRAGISPVDSNQVSVVSVPRVFDSQPVIVTVQVFQ